MSTTNVLTIDATNKSFPLGDMYGAFFEDINHAADGGLYAELIRNRSFEFDAIDNASYNHLTAWSLTTSTDGEAYLTIDSEKPVSPKNPHYAVLNIKSGTAGISNEGFNTGIYVQQDAKYDFSFWSKRDTAFEQNVVISIESTDGTIYDSYAFQINNAWTKYQCVLTSNSTDTSARLVIRTSGISSVCFDLVSLFPQNTFKGRKNGLRKDIATLIADMKPKFLRFPGGCLIHDGALEPDARDSMYRWKNTIGPLEERASRRNNWGYNQTLGLGYYEYFLFCEDIDTKPLPVLPAAYNPHRQIQAPINELQPWIDDALDLIEFANGDTDTTWGKVRADLGHAEPFNLEYLAIGNEELFEPFLERYPYFHNAIKEKYPDIQLISSSGPFADGYDFDLMWDEANKAEADLVDEHYYLSPEWMIKHHYRYDKYDRDGAKVFLGEYATLDNKWINALAEATYMISFERNADIMALTCYAPLLCNIDYVNWKPDMIWYDNNKTLKTVNYHVQQLFTSNQGDYLLNSNLKGGERIVESIADINGGFAFESINESVTFKCIKVNDQTIAENMTYNFDDKTKTATIDNDSFTIVELEQNRPIVKYINDITANSTITFEFVKNTGNHQLKLLFGMDSSNANYYLWEMGSWANDMSIIGKSINGKYSNMNVGSAITISEDVSYNVSLNVNEHTITGVVNDKTYQEFTEMETTLEPLYHSSTIDEQNNEIIIKTANVRNETFNTNIKVETDKHINSICSVITINSDDLKGENTFDEPDKIAPITSEVTVQDNVINYTFAPQSVTIFKLKF